MEHLVFLLIEFVLWLDRRSLRPLNRVVTQLAELRVNPSAVLAEGEVTIGPYRRWGTGTALGLLMGLGIVVLGLLLLLAAGVFPPRGGGQPAHFFLIGLFVIGTPAAAVIAMLRVLQGGRMVLRAGGVELQYHGTTVHCPWGLFAADGAPFQPSKERLLLPVAPAAVPLVEARRNDFVIAQGMAVRTKPLKFKAANLAELRAVYQVEILELGGLLLQLGQQLGAALPEAGPARHSDDEESAELAPGLLRRADGWIKASLVHLTFPPYCCDCGAATADRKEYRGQAAGLLDGGQSVPLSVPVCAACQADFKRSQGRSIFGGIVLGVLAASTLAGALAVMLNVRRRRFLGLGLVLSAIGAIAGGVIGAGVGLVRAQPVRLRAYSPSEGTVLGWFRNVEYADALLEILGGEEEPAEPQTADERGAAYAES